MSKVEEGMVDLSSLPFEVIHIIQEGVIFLPKTNKELREAVQCWIDDKETAMERYGPMELWNTRNITDMSFLFEGAKSFNEPIGSWDTSNVKNMSYMFAAATSFNQPIDSWNTQNVTKMSAMFSFALCFNQSVGSWDTSNVKFMRNVFLGAASFDQPLDL